MIYIIRHGQTELNNAHVLQGRSKDIWSELKATLEYDLIQFQSAKATPVHFKI